MKTELADVSETRKEITIEIAPEVVRRAFDNVSRKYAKGAQVAGFRKGNAPLDVVRMRYKEEIKSETLQELVAEKVTEAIRKHDLTPLVQPELHLDDAENLKLNGSMPLVLHAHVEIMPEIPTPVYKGLQAVRRVKPPDDGEVERFIDERRREQASLIPVEGRKSQTGDTLIVDLEGNFADEPDAEPIRAEDLEITLGDAAIEKSFTDNLSGVEADEEKEFTVVYEPDFSSPALAGKTVDYRAKIKSVGAVELPEADDEWARSLGEEFESLADLRQKLRKDLETHASGNADAKVQNELIAKLIENHAFEVPSSLVEAQSRNLLNNFAQDLQQRGVDLQKVDKEFIEMAYTQMRVQAERDVRGSLLLERVAEIEEIDVTGEEVAAEIERIARYYRTTPEEVRENLTKQGGEENIANNMRTRKAVDAIFRNAELTEGEWIDESQTAAANDEAVSSEEAPEDATEEAKPKTAKKKAAAQTAENIEDAADEPKPSKKAAKKKDKTA